MVTLQQTTVFRRWQHKLKDETARALISAKLYRLREGMTNDVVSVGDGLFELRVHYGPGYRIYFMRQGNRVIVLLCGGDKGTQARDIRQAKALAKVWSSDNG